MDETRQMTKLPPTAARVVRELRRQILSGHLVVDGPLPSVRTLAKCSGLSVFPVQQALKFLEQVGWAIRRTVGGRLVLASEAPDRARRSLASERPAVIHFLCPYHRRLGMEHYYSALAASFGDVFDHCSIRQVAIDTQAGLEQVEQLVHAGDPQVCEVGYVLASMPPTIQSYFRGNGVPCVVLGQSNPEDNLPTLYEDMNHLGYMAGQVLCQSDRVVNLYTGALQGAEVYLIDGVRRAAREMSRREPQWDEFYQICSEDTREQEEQLERLLVDRRGTLGILAMRSEIGLLVVKVANRCGVTIPDALQLISYFHSPMHTLVHPEITSIGPKSLADLGRRCAELLAASMGRRPDAAPRILVESSLMERQSTLPRVEASRRAG